MRRTLVIGGLLAALSAAPAAAQATIGWDAAVFSGYVWRGLHFTSKPVVQPDLYVTIPLGQASLTAGGWANIEVGKYNGTNDISEGGGQAGPDFTEFDWWGEIGVPAGKATLTGGATGYIFPNDFGLTKANNTIEVYGKVALDVPLSPKVSAYYDVDKVKGLYVEGSLSRGFPLGAATLNLGALVGWTGGQECSGTYTFSTNTCSTTGYNFGEKGITHADFSASAGFSAGPLSITPALHVVLGNDKATKFATLNKKHDVKLWGGVTISWSKALGATEEAAE